MSSAIIDWEIELAWRVQEIDGGRIKSWGDNYLGGGALLPLRSSRDSRRRPIRNLGSYRGRGRARARNREQPASRTGSKSFAAPRRSTHCGASGRCASQRHTGQSGKHFLRENAQVITAKPIFFDDLFSATTHKSPSRAAPIPPVIPALDRVERGDAGGAKDRDAPILRRWDHTRHLSSGGYLSPRVCLRQRHHQDFDCMVIRKASEARQSAIIFRVRHAP
jgi:hypothetical protein